MNLKEQLELDVIRQSSQNSIAWDKVRLGRFTGSGLGKLFTEPRSKADKDAGNWSQTAISYIEEKATEIVTGEACGEFSSKATDWGNEWEEHAIRELAKALHVKDDDLTLKPHFVMYGDYSGASPDCYMRIAGDRVGGEVKCPFNPSVHTWRLRNVTSAEQLKDEEPDYYWQVQANMFFGKIPLWYFASYDPRFPPHRRLHYFPVYANVEDMEIILKKMEKALILRDEIVEYIINK